MDNYQIKIQTVRSSPPYLVSESNWCDFKVITALLPNVFTPNNDGYNDCFGLYDTQGLSNCTELVIFNRWGIRIYDNEYGICWDGKTDAGLPVPEGTYYYIITIIDEFKYAGSLTLLRNK